MVPISMKISKLLLFLSISFLTILATAMEAPDTITLQVRLNLEASKGLTKETPETARQGSGMRGSASKGSRLGQRVRSFGALRSSVSKMRIVGNKGAKLESVVAEELQAKHQCRNFHFADPGIRKGMTLKQVHDVIGDTPLVINCWQKPTVEIVAPVPIITIDGKISHLTNGLPPSKKESSGSIRIEGSGSEPLQMALERAIKKMGYECRYFTIYHPIVKLKNSLKEVKQILENTTSELTIRCVKPVIIKATVTRFFSGIKEKIEDEPNLVIEGHPDESIRSAVKRAVSEKEEYRDCEFDIEQAEIKPRAELGDVQYILEKRGEVLRLQCFPKRTAIEWEKVAQSLRLNIIQQGSKNDTYDVDISERKLSDVWKEYCTKVKKVTIQRGDKNYPYKVNDIGVLSLDEIYEKILEGDNENTIINIYCKKKIKQQQD